MAITTPDPAAAETDRIIEEIEKRIKVEYTQAEREIKNKLDDYMRRFQTKDETWQKWVADGRKTQAEYDRWRVGQIAIGQRWEEMRNTISQDLLNTSKIAKSIARGYMPQVYALNHDYGTFQVERGSLVDTSYTLYSREAAERLFRDNPQMLPAPGKKVSQAIADGQAVRWNNQHIQSVIMQTLLQGNSIPDVATRLANAVGDSDRKAATRNARTMVTAAQNAGRIDSYARANELGIETEKQWLATLDSRTRHWHRQLDGETMPVDEPFVNEFGEIMFPGDPDAAPANVYNCRCTLIASIKGHERDLSNTRLRHDKNLGDMTYDEWKESRESTSNPILLPEIKGENIRAGYIREYRGYGGEVAPGRDRTLDIDSRLIDTNQKSSSTVVNGTDISATWQRRPDEYRFEIEDVLNAQGFDGIPRVVSREEFDEAVRAANGGNGFIAQRTYSAPTQEIADAYRDQLYHGKWYVDCGQGGAQYGQGMYSAADYTGTLTDGIKREMEHYVDAGDGHVGYNKYTVASDKRSELARDEKNGVLNSVSDPKERAVLNNEVLHNGTKEEKKIVKSLSKEEKAELIDRMSAVRREAISRQNRVLNTSLDEIVQRYNIDAHAPHYVETFTLDPNAKIVSYDEILRKQENAVSEELRQMDTGAFAALSGYDAINAEGHGESVSYTVILNRTAVIFCGDEYD